MRMNHIVLCSLLGLAAAPALACYTVYDRSDRVVYQSQTPPVDMSRPLHETLQARFPGGHMIFSAGGECEVISSVASGSGGLNLSSASPLLTDERSAKALGLPHTVLSDRAVVVRPRDVSLPPGISVIPRNTAPVAVPSPAAPPSQKTSSRGMTITELRDPPLRVVQSADGMLVSEVIR